MKLHEMHETKTRETGDITKSQIHKAALYKQTAPAQGQTDRRLASKPALAKAKGAETGILRRTERRGDLLKVETFSKTLARPGRFYYGSTNCLNIRERSPRKKDANTDMPGRRAGRSVYKRRGARVPVGRRGRPRGARSPAAGAQTEARGAPARRAPPVRSTVGHERARDSVGLVSSVMRKQR